MTIKHFEINTKDLGKDYYLRNDEKYHVFLLSSGWNIFNIDKRKVIPLKYVLIDDHNITRLKEDKEYKGIPTGQTYLDEDGEIIDFQTITKDNHPARLKYRVSNENILISSVKLAKSPALYFENQDLSDYVFSNGFYIFKVNKKWNIKFVLYLLRTKILKNILDKHIYRGIGISAYKKEDLLKIKIPIIAKSIQDKTASRIKPIELKISDLKKKLIPTQDIINAEFALIFEFDMNSIYSFERIKYLNIDKYFNYRNELMRSSYRWHKIQKIQKIIYKDNRYIKRLGNFIKSTQNGWSPNCRESDILYAVFGIDAISKDTKIKFDNMKYTNDKRDNISEYLAREGDFFVSRGNTVDLVALASILNFPDEEMDIIFSDLFIRIDFDKSAIKYKYMAYLFNSILGRLYFKYSAKGKNQTMVKISKTELNNFYLPIPPMPIQQKIVDGIKTKLEIQEAIKHKIEVERNKIDSIMMKAISYPS